MRPDEWYQSFLNSRSISTPTGIALYSYKITQKEFATLGDVLKNCTHHAMDWDCCFVLYATEWWRRFYEGGNWSWEPILRSVNKMNIRVPDRIQLVARGFRRWRRPVNENLKGNDFIGTVVIECGLPLRVLESEHYLVDIITDLYHEFGAISSIETEHIMWVKSLSVVRRLPLALQKDPFFHLLLQFVTTLVNVNVKHGFSAADKPVEKLDEVSPGWREQFPLRIESNIGKNFIDQLLTGVVKSQAYQPSLIRVTHQLVGTSEKLQLKATLDINAGIYKASALNVSDAEFELISNKLEIYLGTASGDRRIGFAFKNHDPQGIQLDEVCNYTIPASGIGNWELYLLDPQNYRKLPLKITGVQPDPDTDPLIFTNSGDNKHIWKLVAAGTITLPIGIYRLLIKGNAVLESGEWNILGNTVIGDMHFSVYEVSADVTFQYNSNSFYLSFSEADNFTYEVMPSLNSFDFYHEENKAIYRGWPKIYKLRLDGAVIGPVSSGLEYYCEGRWARLIPGITGKVKVRLTSGAHVAFCKTIQVVPENFAVEFNPNERRVDLLHSAPFSISVYSSAKTVIERTADGHCILFKEPDSTIPEFFELGLTTNDGRTDKIILKIPCPKQQLHFYSATKERLAYKSSLYLHDLYGSRLHISNLLPFSQTFRLKVTLHDIQLTEDITVYRSLKVPAYGNFDLALVSLKDLMLSLLSIATNIDAGIVISCEGKAAIEIRQFEFSLKRLEDGCMQMETTKPDYSPPDLMAFRLDKPFNKDEVSTLRSNNGMVKWCIPYQEGIWFIYPAPELKEQFRPLAYNTANDQEPTSIEADRVVRLYEVALLERIARIELIDTILNQMAEDCNHPDWTELNDLYQELQHLPLSSHDVFTRLCSHKKAIMMAALMLPDDMVLRLSQEFAIIWSQYPVEAWKDAIQLFHTYLAALIPLHAQQALTTKLEWLAHHWGLTAIRWVIENMLLDKNETSKVSQDVARMLIAGFLNGVDGRPGLRARHPEEKWPDHLSSVIIDAFKSLPQHIKVLLPVELVQHQKSVICLPFVLAAASVQPEVVKMLKLTPLTKFRIREIISFDEEWFTEVYNLVQGFLLAK